MILIGNLSSSFLVVATTNSAPVTIRKTPVLFVRVTANVKLLAYSEMEILADVSDLPQRNQTYVLEDVNIQNAGVMMTCAVVMTGESVPVHVINPTNQPVTLKGTRIVQLAEIEEMDDSSLIVFSEDGFT